MNVCVGVPTCTFSNLEFLSHIRIRLPRTPGLWNCTVSQSVSYFTVPTPDPRFLFSEFCTLLDATFKVQPSPRARYLSEHRRTRRGVPNAPNGHNSFKNSFLSQRAGIIHLDSQRERTAHHEISDEKRVTVSTTQ